MTIVWIDKGEWYPVYSLDEAKEAWRSREIAGIEISDAEYADYKRVMTEFNAWQAKLFEMERENRKGRARGGV